MDGRPDRSVLVVISNVGATRLADGMIGLTAKFVDGMVRYAELWDGPVRCICAPSSDAPDGHMDPVSVEPGACGFDVRVAGFDAATLRPLIADAAVVLVSVGYQQDHISTLGRELGVPVVYVSELSLPTRVAIARAEVASPIRLARRMAWEVGQERRQRRAIRRASGVQCNGTPTFDAYSGLSEHPLLYFDTRSDSDLMASDEAIERRLVGRRHGPLRLAFSGRLVAIKGVDHLVRLADELARRGVDFELDVFGDGDRRQPMQREVERLGLTERVRLRGALDFAAELVPTVRDSVDLFVCCHLQGDPSCTYLETMACGVPIVGYANEALSGLLTRVNAGCATKLRDVDALADAVQRVSRRREQLTPWARTAVAFAREHSFERTFERRIAHIAEVAGFG